MSDDQIFHIITNGTRQMPSYSSQVSRDDRWKAILTSASCGPSLQQNAGD